MKAIEKINRKLERLEEEAAKGYPAACDEDIARKHDEKKRVVKRFIEEVKAVKEIAEYAELNNVTIKLVGGEKIKKIKEEADFVTVEADTEFTKAVSVSDYDEGEGLYIYIAPFNAIYKR